MPLDPSRVSSGFDIEIGLAPRYLQHLLLLALDAGEIPAFFAIDDPDHPERPPVFARFLVPNGIVRTYPLREDAELPLVQGDAGFDVALLFDDPQGADLRVTTRVHLTNEAGDIDLIPTWTLFVRLSLQKTRSADGRGLDAAGLGIELVRTIGVDFARARAAVDRVVSLDGLANGGRIEDIALRKFPAEGDTPASLSLCLNLRLRNGPQDSAFVPPRGDAHQGRNILPPEADLVFATRRDIFPALAADTFFRRAVPDGAGFRFPLRVGGQDAQLLSVSAAPTDAHEGPNRLRLILKAELDVVTDPEVTLLVDLFGDIDSEGVMRWRALTEVHESSLLTQFLFGLATLVVAAFSPELALLLLVDLELAKQGVEELVNLVAQSRAQKRLDATLLDIAPNRLSLFRRRWDPLYTTQHQIGLRDGATRIDTDGIALWGRAVLTRATTPQADAVIRDSVHDGEAAPTALRYRAPGLAPEDFHLLTDVMPATDRRAFTQVDVAGEGPLFELSIAEARERLAVRRLAGPLPYLVQRVDLRAGQIHHLLVISQRESDEQRGRLIEAQAELVEPFVLAREPQVRAQVLADFAAAGLFPTAGEVDAAVAAALQGLVHDAEQAYIDGDLQTDLEAALEPLLRLELAPTHFGELQRAGLLTIRDFELVFVAARRTFYYRDRFVPTLETTKARRLADNLARKPRFRPTPRGPVFID